MLIENCCCNCLLIHKKNLTVELEKLSVWVKNLLTIIRSDIARNRHLQSAINVDDNGYFIPKAIFASYGIDILIIEGELQRNSLIKNIIGDSYYVAPDFGEWLISGR